MRLKNHFVSSSQTTVKMVIVMMAASANAFRGSPALHVRSTLMIVSEMNASMGDASILYLDMSAAVTQVFRRCLMLAFDPYKFYQWRVL